MCRLVSIKSNDGQCIEVADIKKSYIENIISSASKCKQIHAVILFGSALEERCTEKSDIDIAIISKYTVDKLSGIKSYSRFVNEIYEMDLAQEYDKLYFKSLEEIEEQKEDAHICKELVQKGKVIYRNSMLLQSVSHLSGINY